MATFIPGMTDKFPQMDLYKPDYEFLTQVLGTKQGEYDRGFKHVQGIINSALNGPITSKENESYRKELFKKIQGSLKSVSNMDLSNPTNIQNANSIVDPIAKDKELAYDMAYTKYMQNERSKYNSLKNSNDAKERAKANDYSAAYMNISDKQMASSKRGDGSILKIQPNEFVAFEDANAFLDERAKADKLKIKQVYQDGFYIKTVTNGEGAIKPFYEWSKDVLKSSGIFDKQFRVMGTVAAESQIENEMKASNVSREQAAQTIGKKLYQPVIDETNKNFTIISKYKSDADQKLLLFEREHMGGIPASKQQYYNTLLKNQKEAESKLNTIQAEKDDLNKGGADFISGNLSSMYEKQALREATGSWAENYARSTAELEIDTDEVKLKMYEVGVSTSLKIAEMKQAKELAYAKMTNDSNIAAAKLSTDIKIAIAEGKLPSSEVINTYTPAGGGIPAVDLLTVAQQKNNNDMYNHSFNPQTGIVSMVVGSQNAGMVSSLMAKLKSKADGNTQNFTEEDLKQLAVVGKTIGLKNIVKPSTQEIASALLNVFEVALFKKAKEAVKVLKDQGTIGKYYEQVKTLSLVEGAFTTAMNQRQELDKTQRRIANAMLDSNGQVKEQYKDNVVFTGRTLNGTPTFDLTKLTQAQKDGLTKYVGDEFKKATTSTVVVRNNKLVGSDEWSNIFTDSNEALSNSPTLFAKYAKYGDPSKSEIFGNQYEVSANPNTRTIEVTLRTNPDKLKTISGEKNPDITPLKITIPFDRINSSPTLARFKKYVDEVESKPQSLGLNFSKFRSEPNITITAPSYVKSSGFDYSVSGIKDNNGYKLLYHTRYKNPATNNWSSTGVVVKELLHESDLDGFLSVENDINQQFNMYHNFNKDHETKVNTSQSKIPYKK